MENPRDPSSLDAGGGGSGGGGSFGGLGGGGDFQPGDMFEGIMPILSPIAQTIIVPGPSGPTAVNEIVTDDPFTKTYQVNGETQVRAGLVRYHNALSGW